LCDLHFSHGLWLCGTSGWWWCLWFMNGASTEGRWDWFMSLTKRLMRLWVQNHLVDELCHSFYWGLQLDLISYRGFYLAANLLPKKNKFQLWFVCVCVCVWCCRWLMIQI
jgi:hypothetical protein